MDETAAAALLILDDALDEALALAELLDDEELLAVALIDGVPVVLVDGVPVVLVDGVPVTLMEGVPVVLVDGVPVTLMDGVPVVLVDGVPVTLMDGVPVVLVDGVPVVLVDGVPVTLMDGVPVALALDVAVAVCDGDDPSLRVAVMEDVGLGDALPVALSLAACSHRASGPAPLNGAPLASASPTALPSPCEIQDCSCREAESSISATTMREALRGERAPSQAAAAPLLVGSVARRWRDAANAPPFWGRAPSAPCVHINTIDKRTSARGGA